MFWRAELLGFQRSKREMKEERKVIYLVFLLLRQTERGLNSQALERSSISRERECWVGVAIGVGKRRCRWLATGQIQSERERERG